jgi:hypothetical protein
MSFDILNRWTGAVVFHSETAATRGEAAEEAVRSRADLSGADLSGAYLSRADLSGADLSGADLSDLKILQVAGSRDFIVALSAPEGVEVRVGCQHHSLTHWLEHYKAIGRANGYGDDEIAEYGLHLGYVEQWAKTIIWPEKSITDEMRAAADESAARSIEIADEAF